MKNNINTYNCATTGQQYSGMSTFKEEPLQSKEDQENKNTLNADTTITIIGEVATNDIAEKMQKMIHVASQVTFSSNYMR